MGKKWENGQKNKCIATKIPHIATNNNTYCYKNDVQFANKKSYNFCNY